MNRATLAAIALTFCCACNADKRAIEDHATWLCKNDMLEEPSDRFLQEGVSLRDHVSSDDLAYLQETKASSEEGAFAAFGAAMVAALTPAARVMRDEVAKRTACDVSVSLDGSKATATVTRTAPRPTDDGDPISRLEQLSQAENDEDRRALVEGWFEGTKPPETVHLEFIKEGDGWRASYGLGAIAQQTRRKELEGELARLREVTSDAEEARASLGQFEVKEARLTQRTQRYTGRIKPQLDLRIANNTGHPISRAYFHGTVGSPGRAVPWIDEAFNYQIPGGVEDGETVEWNLAPNMFSRWGEVRVPDDAVLSVDVTRLDGADGETLWQLPEEDPTVAIEQLTAELAALED